MNEDKRTVYSNKFELSDKSCIVANFLPYRIEFFKVETDEKINELLYTFGECMYMSEFKISELRKFFDDSVELQKST